MEPNSVYTDARVRITIDIADAGYIALSTLLSVTWNIGCQYNNINMPDNCPRAMSALGRGNQVSACGRTRSDVLREGIAAYPVNPLRSDGPECIESIEV